MKIRTPHERLYLKTTETPAPRPMSDAEKNARAQEQYNERVRRDRHNEDMLKKACRKDAEKRGQYVATQHEQRIYKRGDRFLFGVFAVDDAAPLVFPVCHDGEKPRVYIPRDIPTQQEKTCYNHTAWNTPKTAYDDMITARFDVAICMDFLNKLECKGNEDAATIRREYLRGIHETNVCFDDLLQELRLCLWEVFQNDRATWGTDGFIVLDADAAQVWRDMYGSMSSFLWKHRTQEYKRLYVLTDDETLVSLSDRKTWAEKTDIDALLASDTITTFFQYIRENSTNAAQLIKTAELLMRGYTYKDAARVLGLKSPMGVKHRQAVLHTLYRACFKMHDTEKRRETWEKTTDGMERKPRYIDADAVRMDAARKMNEYRNTYRADTVASYTLA